MQLGHVSRLVNRSMKKPLLIFQRDSVSDDISTIN